jgi:glucose-1-phosphate adenylyltransferase
MDGDGILALVLAGGAGTRLRPLTDHYPKPVLPFGGRRIIDFTLSNLVNSGIGAIYVLAQYKPRPLIEHVESVWAPMVRGPRSLVRVRVPAPTDDAFQGTADAVYKCLDLLERHRPRVVAIFAADHVYRMDVRQMATFHADRSASVTVAALPVPLSAARSFGAITTASDGRIESFEEKPRSPPPMPQRPTHAFASMGIYLFKPHALAELVAAAHARGETDFGRHILPRVSKTHQVYAYDFAGNRVPGLLDGEEACYWRDVGTLEAYRAAQDDLLGPHPRFRLDNALWPIHGGASDPIQRTFGGDMRAHGHAGHGAEMLGLPDGDIPLARRSSGKTRRVGAADAEGAMS